MGCALRCHWMMSVDGDRTRQKRNKTNEHTVDIQYLCGGWRLEKVSISRKMVGDNVKK